MRRDNKRLSRQRKFCCEGREFDKDVQSNQLRRNPVDAAGYTEPQGVILSETENYFVIRILITSKKRGLKDALTAV